MTRRAVQTRFQKVDFFGCDVMGKDGDSRTFWAQVTTGQADAVLQRKKKLLAFPWGISDRVFVLRMLDLPDPANLGKKLWYFQVHQLALGEWYQWEEAYPVPTSWFRAHKAD